MSRIGASVANARARPTRCCMPPESSPTLASARSARPTSSSWRRTRSARSRFGTPPSSRPRPTFSATLRQGSRPNCWNTIATHSRRRYCSSSREAPDTSASQFPSRTMTLPRVTGFSPLTARSRVDLPDPESPISTRISPARTPSEQSCTPITCPVRAVTSARSSPSSSSGSARSGRLPNTIVTRSKITTSAGAVIAGRP